MRRIILFSNSVLWNGVTASNQVSAIRCVRYSASEKNAYQSEDDLPDVNRNKSRLLRHNRNALLNAVPYNEACSWIHETEKFKRRMFGRYGFSSGINPYICFSNRRSDSGSIEEPYSLQQLLVEQGNINLMKAKAIEKREKEIASKLEKLEQWKMEMKNKMEKKKADAMAAKEQKQRLIEEVRRHFGFKVDPREERFKEMLEQKEREEKRKHKEAKRKAKEDKMMANLTKNNFHG